MSKGNKLQGQRGKLLPSPHKEEAKLSLREGTDPEEVASRFDLSIYTVRNYQKEIKREDAEAAEAEREKKANQKPEEIFEELQPAGILEKQPPIAKQPEGEEQIQAQPQPPPTTQPQPPSGGIRQNIKYGPGGAVAAVLSPQPAAIAFKWELQEIGLVPEKMVEAHMIYTDLVARGLLSDTFSNFLLDGASLLWQILAVTPKIDGRVNAEVS